MYKKGELIQKSTGELAEVTRGPYTHRFMEDQDWDMVNGGMGEYAGVYASAYDVTYMTGNWQGRTMRIRFGKGGWKRVAASEASHEKTGQE